MIFNSIDFAVFFPVVFLLYWFVFRPYLKAQNFFIVVVSYFFYGWWDWRFLALLLFSSLVDFGVGLLLAKEERTRWRFFYLMLSLVVNLGMLGFFKYYNFFVHNFVSAFTLLGMPFRANTLEILLPVGISFYTFQTLSYTIDVYRRHLTPSTDWVSFLAYVSFFPQLVAGPIERATHLLPQFYSPRTFDAQKAADGLRQILWGLFKKVVIADSCAPFVNEAFAYTDQYNSTTLLLGAVFFAFQIYGDFSGYSDIAVGSAKLLGFDLMQNFAYPYFSRDMTEFWRRWHISLSSWFRDYVYVPLGGNRVKAWRNALNIGITFLLSGFWHGAGWSFLVWGALNAAYFLPLVILKKHRNHVEIVSSVSFITILRILLTFFITVLTWIFFRAHGLSHAFLYFKRLATATWQMPQIDGGLRIGLLIGILVGMEWLQRQKPHGLSFGNHAHTRPWRWFAYLIVMMMIVVFGAKSQDFIYFQF